MDHSRSLKIAPFESLGTVSYSRSTATMAVSLAVSAQDTNVTDTQPDTQTPQENKSRTRLQSRGKKTRNENMYGSDAEHEVQPSPVAVLRGIAFRAL